MEVTKCLGRKDGIKYAIIPKRSDIIKGDPIMIIKINEEEVRDGIKRKKQGSRSG